MTTLPRTTDTVWQDEVSNVADPKTIVGLRRPLRNINLNHSSSSNSSGDKVGMGGTASKTTINKPKRHPQRSRTEPSPSKSNEAPPRPVPKSFSARDTSDDSNYYQPFMAHQTRSLFRKRNSLIEDSPLNDFLALKLANPVFDESDSEAEELEDNEMNNLHARTESVHWKDQLTTSICYTTTPVLANKTKPTEQRPKTEPTILIASSCVLEPSIRLSLNTSDSEDDSLEYSSHSLQFFTDEQGGGVFRSERALDAECDDLLALKLASPVLSDSEEEVERVQHGSVETLYWHNHLKVGQPLPVRDNLF